MQKAWKFKRLLLQTKNPLKICVNNGFLGAVIPRERRNSEY